MESKEVKPRFKKGFWKPEEDLVLKKYVETHGEGNWSAVAKKSGLMRGAKSCRLRWKNYLRPNIKRGMMSEDEKDLIIRLHKLLGNRWALIAGRLPGRTDNEVKNFWNTHLNKKVSRDQTKGTHQSPASSHAAGVENPRPTTADSNKEAENGAAVGSCPAQENVESAAVNMPPLPPQYSPFLQGYEGFVPMLDNLVLMDQFDEMMQETIFWEI